MKSIWLEKLAEDGVVRPEVKEAIYRDCSNLIVSSHTFPKTAGEVLALGEALSLEKLGQAFADSYLIIKEGADDGKPKPRKADLGKSLDDRLHRRISKLIGKNTGDLKRQVSRSLKQMTESEKRLLQNSQRQSRNLNNSQKNLLLNTQKQLRTMGRNLSKAQRGAVGRSIEPGDVGKLLKSVGILGSVALLGGIGSGAAKHLIGIRDKNQLEKGLRSSFDAAMKMSPADKEPLHDNPAKSRQAFDTLAHFAPHVAVQPSAARAFMNRLIHYDMALQATDVKDLSEIERNLAQARGDHPPFIAGFGAGVDALGLSQAAGQAYKNVLSEG